MSELDFEDLLTRLHKQARTRPRMVEVILELTYGCNLRCVHCYNPTHEAKGELTTEQVRRVLDGLAAHGCLLVGVSGGELFTRRDAFEIIRYAKELGLFVSILSNATMITPAVADQLQEVEPYLMSVSIFGATSDTYEAVTRIPGSFAQFVRGVDLLVERRVATLLKLVMMTVNIHEFGAMLEFAEARKLPYKVSTEIHPKVNGSREPLAYRLPPEQVVEVRQRLDGARQPRQVALSVGSSESEDRCQAAGNLFNCACGKSSATVTPYGKLNLCVSIHHPQYDVVTGGVEEGWQQLVAFVASATPQPTYECGHCPVARCCTRGPQDGWLEHRTFDGPCIPHFREVAERTAKLFADVGDTGTVDSRC